MFNNSGVNGSWRKYVGKKNLIVGFEDRYPRPLAGTHLVVLRDPYNWLASRYEPSRLRKLRKTGYEPPEDGPFLRSMLGWLNTWKTIAKLHPNDFPPTYGNSRARVVLYNSWFLDEAYRRELAGWLGREFTDAGLNDINKQYGSSFDRHSYQGRAQEMKTLERYKTVVTKPIFEKIFADDEAAEIASELFGAAFIANIFEEFRSAENVKAREAAR
ncbi:MAG TPA: hypothetical protein ENH11_00080 [Candidatus Acetothermia bacterium]|nr:hypothetical protein [Candidatus Acetothermia bacterium]